MTNLDVKCRLEYVVLFDEGESHVDVLLTSTSEEAARIEAAEIVGKQSAYLGFESFDYIKLHCGDVVISLQ